MLACCALFIQPYSAKYVSAREEKGPARQSTVAVEWVGHPSSAKEGKFQDITKFQLQHLLKVLPSL